MISTLSLAWNILLSVKIPFEVQLNDTFTDREQDQAATINQYVQDEMDINNNTVTGTTFTT